LSSAFVDDFTKKKDQIGMKRRGDRLVHDLKSIDRDSYEPAYAQLATILRRQIAEGIFRPGDQLPSEAQLCQRYDVSPMTVRRTINLLADQGVVSTAQGRGTFVRAIELSSATFNLHELQDLFADTSNTEIRLLDARIVSADEETACRLKVDAGKPVIYIRRLLLRHQKPLFYHRGYLVYDPRRPIVEAEMDSTSLQGLFTNADQTILKRGELTVRAILLNEEEAQLLQAASPSAAFSLEHIFYDFDDRPLSAGWFICRSDALFFRTTVGIDEK
jgi:DNA-binding GntR family transcriptional regulator